MIHLREIFNIIVLTLLVLFSFVQEIGAQELKSKRDLDIENIIKLIVNTDSTTQLPYFALNSKLYNYTLTVKKHKIKDSEGNVGLPPPPPENFFDYYQIKHDLRKYTNYSLTSIDSTYFAEQIETLESFKLNINAFNCILLKKRKTKKNSELKYLYEFYLPIFTSNQSIAIVDYKKQHLKEEIGEYGLKFRAYFLKEKNKWNLVEKYILYDY
jgi:hypothetical protein